MELPLELLAPSECPYCHGEVMLTNGQEIYPHRPDLHQKPFWICRASQAWVGCHPGTFKPLGRLANAELRRAKSAAHAAFDPLWKTGTMRRDEAYAWLCHGLGIPRREVHIGMFDVETCRQVVALCAAREVSV